MSRVGLTATIVIAVVGIGTGPAAATLIEVTMTKDEFGAGGTRKCALREAIQAANEDHKFGGCAKGSGADRVVLRGATYKLSITGSGEDANESGDLDSSENLTIDGFGIGRTTINGNGNVLQERILEQVEGTLTVRELTMRNADAYSAEWTGAAVANDGATGKVTNLIRVSLEDNYSYYYGGGVFSDSGPLNVIGSRIADNGVDDYGGGISTEGPYRLMVRNSRVAGNTADDGGGGIYVSHPEARTVIEKTVISGNAGAGYAGGIYLDGISARISRSTISNNYNISDDGGGVYIGTIDNPAVIESSTVSGNHAYDDGGGIYVGGDLTVRNSTITRNVAVEEGGALYLAGDAGLRNVTLARNYGRGGFGGVATNGLAFSYRNSIIALNRAGADGGYFADCEPAGTLSLGHNLIGDGTCNTIAADLTAGTVPLDPRLGLLGRNGGPTETLALLSGSPAIDNGRKCLPRDQRGVTRKGRGKRCDIGAFER